MPSRIPQTLCLLVLFACVPLARAQQPVYRCIGAHGEPVFSGQPCGTPAPPPGQSASLQGDPFRGVCAASPQELRQAIATAFTTHDVNRLAGLILWRGMDQASSRTVLHGLAAWLKQPLAGIAIDYANGPPFADSGPSPPTSAGAPANASSVASRPPAGFEVSTGGAEGSTRAFGVTEFGGCWWLTF